jgi:hypothetical protein
MANELEVTGIIKYSKAGIKSELSLSTRIDITNNLIHETIQEIAAAEEGTVLSIPQMKESDAFGPYVIIENLDDTNSVVIRGTTNVSESDVIEIKPGQFAGPMQLRQVKNTNEDTRLVAFNAACKVRVIAIAP